MASVTVDINDFSSPQFNPKSWINSVLKPSTATSTTNDQDDAAKDTTILVTKLQMVSESTSRQFDTLSTSVIKSMPRVMYDLKVISETAKSTHQGVEAIKNNMGLIEGDTEAALNRLRRPHVAKTRMNECKALLEEKANELEEQRKAKEALDELIRKNQEEEKEAAEAEAEAERKRLEKEEEEEAEKKRLTALKDAEEREERERKSAAALKQEEALEAAKKKQQEETSIYDEGLEYGHVQLPPLRSNPPPRRVQTPTLHALQAQQQQTEDNSYLQQIQDSMTPSNVFKRIGVPLDKFWQSSS